MKIERHAYEEDERRLSELAKEITPQRNEMIAREAISLAVKYLYKCKRQRDTLTELQKARNNANDSV